MKKETQMTGRGLENQERAFTEGKTENLEGP